MDPVAELCANAVHLWKTARDAGPEQKNGTSEVIDDLLQSLRYHLDEYGELGHHDLVVYLVRSKLTTRHLGAFLDVKAATRYASSVQNANSDIFIDRVVVSGSSPSA